MSTQNYFVRFQSSATVPAVVAEDGGCPGLEGSGVPRCGGFEFVNSEWAWRGREATSDPTNLGIRMAKTYIIITDKIEIAEDVMPKSET